MMMESLLLPGCPGAAVTTSDGLREPRLLPAGEAAATPAAASSSANFFSANCGILVVVCEIVVTYPLNAVASFIVRVGQRRRRMRERHLRHWCDLEVLWGSRNFSIGLMRQALEMTEDSEERMDRRAR